MISAMNQLLSASGQVAIETVKEFVKYAGEHGVDIPEEVLEGFLAKLPETATAKRGGKGTRGPSRNPVSSFLLYRREKKDDIDSALCVSDERERVLSQFEEDTEQAEKVEFIRQWGAEFDAADEPKPAPSAQNMVRMAALLWSMETEETREAYKTRAREENEAFQQANPEPSSTAPRLKTTAPVRPRKTTEPESLSNFKNLDLCRYLTDDDHTPDCCGAWMKRGNKYCSRKKKAGEDTPFCKAHTTVYEEAVEIFPPAVEDDSDVDVDE